jgi:hypothetical protein
MSNITHAPIAMVELSELKKVLKYDEMSELELDKALAFALSQRRLTMLRATGSTEIFIVLILDTEVDEILSPARIYHLQAEGWRVDHVREGTPVFNQITEYWKSGKLRKGGNKISPMAIPITGGSMN